MHTYIHSDRMKDLANCDKSTKLTHPFILLVSNTSHFRVSFFSLSTRGHFDSIRTLGCFGRHCTHYAHHWHGGIRVLRLECPRTLPSGTAQARYAHFWRWRVSSSWWVSWWGFVLLASYDCCGWTRNSLLSIFSSSILSTFLRSFDSYASTVGATRTKTGTELDFA